jgi:para-nitrobenzyl esterase
MMDHLVAFARDGRPGTDWPAWTANAERELSFGDSIGEKRLDGARLDWLETHPISRSTPPARPTSPRD